MTERSALITGVTGYVGGLLVEPLLHKGYRVRVLTRSAAKLADETWRDQVEIVEGDASEAADLAQALDNIDVAYYLLHSMDGEGGFRERDREMAESFARAAEEQQVSRIVYLGGLHPDQDDVAPDALSDHLASRMEVGQVFLDSAVPAACLQAGMVLGADSTSFIILRYLAQRLPIIAAPAWLDHRVQCIAVEDALHYLAESAELDPQINRTFDIGGPEAEPYLDVLREYCRVAGIRRLVTPMPLITPALASHWIALITPASAGVARPLVDSLAHDMVCGDRDLESLVGPPPGGPTSLSRALRRAEESSGPAENAAFWLQCAGYGAAATAVATAALGIGRRLRRN